MPAKPDPHDVLIAELQQQPVADVLGVFGASGMAGVSSGNDVCPWILQFTLAAWKYVGGDIQNRELTVRKLVSEQELHSTMGQFEAYDIIHIRARVAEQNSFGKPQALLKEIIGKDLFNADLKKRALELQEPVTFEDERFGVFTLNRRIDWYEAVVTWGSTDISLMLPAEEPDAIKKCLLLARSMWDLQSVWNERITALAVSELLSLKNEGWLDEGEERLSTEQFKQRLIPNSLDVNADGHFEFRFDDSDMFGGHTVRVCGILSEGPTSAGLEG